MFVNKQSQTLRVSDWIIFRNKNAKFSGSYFYMKTRIKGDFQICISVPLTGNINLTSNYIHRIIFKEAAREVKEAAQSTCAEDFFESPF